MTIQSPEEFLIHELKDIQDAEKQASQTLQKLDGAIENDQLKKMVDQRMQQGERVLQEVEQGLEQLGGSGGSVQNAAARGLIQEAEKLLNELQSPDMKQAAIIAGLQKLEHYCIAAWGTVKAMAQECGQKDLAKAMEREIKEGYQWDGQMTKLAESRINPQALEVEERGGGQSQQSGNSGGSSAKSSSAQGSNDLGEREYRDEQGAVHHHTRSYMERKGE